jgi:hypothetical protein
LQWLLSGDLTPLLLHLCDMGRLYALRGLAGLLNALAGWLRLVNALADGLGLGPNDDM